MNRFFTILSMAAVVFAACDKENETPGQKIDPAELVEVTFDVSAKTNQSAEVQNVSTKTEIKEDGTVTGAGFGSDQLYGLNYEIFLGNEE